MQTKIGHCGKSLADPGCRVQQTGGAFCDALSCDPALAHCSTKNRNRHWKYTSEADVHKVLEPARVCSEAQAEHEEGQSTLLAHRKSVPPPQPIWNVRIFGSLAFGASPENSSQGLQSAFLASAGQGISPQG